jgi:hypothetical protein
LSPMVTARLLVSSAWRAARRAAVEPIVVMLQETAAVMVGESCRWQQRRGTARAAWA